MTPAQRARLREILTGHRHAAWDGGAGLDASLDAIADVFAEGAKDTARPEWVVAIENEVAHAIAKHGSDPWGRHELHGVVEEEYDEFKRTIYADEPTERVLKEAVEVCAVMVRYMLTGDRYRGPHPAIPLRAALDAAASTGERKTK